MKSLALVCLRRLSGIGLLAVALPLSGQQGAGELQALAAELALLEAEVQVLEAENEIENLQRIFGFYFDKNLWTHAADLFTDDAAVELGGAGVYIGKPRILAYFKSLGAEGPQEGILNEHMQLQPIITVAPDGLTARGRWQHFSQEARFGVDHYWGTGVYENEYRFEDGVWKLSRLHLYSTMRTPYEAGWAVTALPASTPDRILPPDQPPSVVYQNYPAVFVPPYHFDNPVTNGKSPVQSGVPVVDLAGIEQGMADLDRRLGLLQDADEIERLHTIYGYYLARNQWDDLAGIFTPDGSIEIALRGIYQGRAGVRRNLDLYGVQNELPGELHNHMQFQPVIHVATDGQSAQMRSRAFSMMGSYGRSGRWMGGIYENVFQKRDGVWMLHKDQVINTYFADYEVGWKELQWRPAPGVTEANPPDAPPSLYFEMYPRAYLPAFHYANPVSGRP